MISQAEDGMIGYSARINNVPADLFKLEAFTSILTMRNEKSSNTSTAMFSMNRIGSKILTPIKKTFTKATLDIQSDLKAAWPVDTGRSRDGWKIHPERYDWSITNNVKAPLTNLSYIQGLWVGMPIGSPQMPMGGEPILRANAKRLQSEIKRVVG